MTPRKRRRMLRAVKRAAGAELVATITGGLPDDDLARLWCVVKRGGDVAEAVAAVDAARRLRPRDKMREFVDWFRLPKGASTVRVLSTKWHPDDLLHEHTTKGRERC